VIEVTLRSIKLDT